MLFENRAGKNAFPDYPVRHPKMKIAYPANGWYHRMRDFLISLRWRFFNE